MFTVLSNTRNTNLCLIVGITIMVVVLATFVVAPSIAAPKLAITPVTDNSEYPDYYQRHPELRTPAGIGVDTSDYISRHPELSGTANSVDYTDYFLRHPEFNAK